MIRQYLSEHDPMQEMLKETVINLTKDCFLLWMYVAQEGYFEDAIDFVKSQRTNKTLFNPMIQLGALQQELWSENDETEMK